MMGRGSFCAVGMGVSNRLAIVGADCVMHASGMNVALTLFPANAIVARESDEDRPPCAAARGSLSVKWKPWP